VVATRDIAAHQLLSNQVLGARHILPRSQTKQTFVCCSSAFAIDAISWQPSVSQHVETIHNAVASIADARESHRCVTLAGKHIVAMPSVSR
jgi:hypothetical protein